jgi:vancomycin resistance protein VanW
VFPDVSRTQPFGSGATCSYPNIDLQIKNDTDLTFQLKLELTETYLIGRWLCNKPLNIRYSISERNHLIKHEWWGGYTRNNELVRTIYDIKTGLKISDEIIVTNHAIMMYQPFLENSINK